MAPACSSSSGVQERPSPGNPGVAAAAAADTNAAQHVSSSGGQGSLASFMVPPPRPLRPAPLPPPARPLPSGFVVPPPRDVRYVGPCPPPTRARLMAIPEVAALASRPYPGAVRGPLERRPPPPREVMPNFRGRPQDLQMALQPLGPPVSALDGGARVRPAEPSSEVVSSDQQLDSPVVRVLQEGEIVESVGPSVALPSGVVRLEITHPCSAAYPGSIGWVTQDAAGGGGRCLAPGSRPVQAAARTQWLIWHPRAHQRPHSRPHGAGFANLTWRPESA